MHTRYIQRPDPTLLPHHRARRGSADSAVPEADSASMGSARLCAIRSSRFRSACAQASCARWTSQPLATSSAMNAWRFFSRNSSSLCALRFLRVGGCGGPSPGAS